MFQYILTDILQYFSMWKAWSDKDKNEYFSQKDRFHLDCNKDLLAIAEPISANLTDTH